eukprot:15168726-Alexandrium_andersonii.AAC.1
MYGGLRHHAEIGLERVDRLRTRHFDPHGLGAYRIAEEWGECDNAYYDVGLLVQALAPVATGAGASATPEAAFVAFTCWSLRGAIIQQGRAMAVHRMFQGPGGAPLRPPMER